MLIETTFLVLLYPGVVFLRSTDATPAFYHNVWLVLLKPGLQSLSAKVILKQYGDHVFQTISVQKQKTADVRSTQDNSKEEAMINPGGL